MAEFSRFTNMIDSAADPGCARFESFSPMHGLQTKTVWIDAVGKTANPFVLR